MPKISQAFENKKISFPSYPDSEVYIKNSVTVGDIEEAESIEGDFSKGIFLACKAIASWNFQDEDGKELPISVESLKKFPSSDLEFLIDIIAPIFQKKTVSGKTS